MRLFSIPRLGIHVHRNGVYPEIYLVAFLSNLCYSCSIVFFSHLCGFRQLILQKVAVGEHETGDNRCVIYHIHIFALPAVSGWPVSIVYLPGRRGEDSHRNNAHSATCFLHGHAFPSGIAESIGHSAKPNSVGMGHHRLRFCYQRCACNLFGNLIRIYYGRNYRRGIVWRGCCGLSIVSAFFLYPLISSIITVISFLLLDFSFDEIPDWNIGQIIIWGSIWPITFTISIIIFFFVGVLRKIYW